MGLIFPLRKFKCSCSVAALILAVVVVVHLFLFRLAPSFDYSSLLQAQNSCTVVNSSENGQMDAPGLLSDDGKGGDMEPSRRIIKFSAQFPADRRNAVFYRNAPWKAEIGQWLSGCDSNVTSVAISEKIGGRSCEKECNGKGVCNHELGLCRCFHGYAGEGCLERLQLDCNHPKSEKEPFGRWVVSICPAYCDKSRAMCFCGEGTKYPERPAPETCGFKINPPREPGGPRWTDWSLVETNIFTTNVSIPGWCNVEPAEAYASRAKVKEECDCKYDGLWGRYCEIPVQSVCINQCSGRGHCRGGFCQCRNGWYGVDCSVPSVKSSVGEWPEWLLPAKLNLPNSENVTEKITNLNSVVQKKRPLIYIYDLPPEFNSLLLEGRHFKLECVNRYYDDRNATVWFGQLYGSQMAIYESLLASPHRTLNGDEADYFFVPVLDSCIITRADDAPHLSMKDHGGKRSSFTLDFYKKAYEHIMLKYSYWNQSSGKDHIWFFSWDEGACYAPKEIWSSIMLVHWGNTNIKHKNSTTAYWADNWDSISKDRRGTHPCFDPMKDIVLPAWKSPDEYSLTAKLWSRPREKRNTLFYFNGNLGPAYEHGRPEDTYSMGIRQKVAKEFGSVPNKEGKLGKQHVHDVIVTPLRTDHYQDELANSTFCGVMPGDGWSGRMEDSILQGCIPVIIQDGIYLPYENFFNYESFAVRVLEDDIPNMIHVLRSINETEVEMKLSNVKKIWQRFVYQDSIMLEAKRQKDTVGLVENWAVRFSELKEDDVFATLMQILHYKLHNDPWRRNFALRKNKDIGLPMECMGRP